MDFQSHDTQTTQSSLQSQIKSFDALHRKKESLKDQNFVPLSRISGQRKKVADALLIPHCEQPNRGRRRLSRRTKAELKSILSRVRPLATLCTREPHRMLGRSRPVSALFRIIELPTERVTGHRWQRTYGYFLRNRLRAGVRLRRLCSRRCTPGTRARPKSQPCSGPSLLLTESRRAQIVLSSG